jgi:dTDP-glucose 4,6-dehydratase
VAPPSIVTRGIGGVAISVQYVDDLIEGTIRLMYSSERRPVNLGNPTEYSVREVANLILSLSQSESSLIHKPLPEDDPKQRCPDISRARESLGWEPQVSAKEGLDLTIGWFAKRRADVTLQR